MKKELRRCESFSALFRLQDNLIVQLENMNLKYQINFY